jgi:hypothetical protein
MRAVRDHGTPLVDDPRRLDGVAALGRDETSFLKASRRAPTPHSHSEWTTRAWQTEILAWHLTTGCSNGPTERSTCSSRK